MLEDRACRLQVFTTPAEFTNYFNFILGGPLTEITWHNRRMAGTPAYHTSNRKPEKSKEMCHRGPHDPMSTKEAIAPLTSRRRMIKEALSNQSLCCNKGDKTTNLKTVLCVTLNIFIL